MPDVHDQEIAKEWLGFDSEKRSRLLSKMSPEQKKNLRRHLESGGLSSVSGPPTGLDASKSRFWTDAYNAKDKIVENLPTIGGVVGGLVGSMAGPPGAVAGAALGGAAGRAAQHLEEFGEEGKVQPSSAAAAWDITHAGGEQGLYELGGMGIAKMAKLINPVSRAARISYGAGATQGEKVLDSLIPDFDKTLKTMGSRGPQTIGEFEHVVQATNTRLENEYAFALQPIAGQQIVPINVANAIRAKITPAMAKTAEGRATMRALQKRALEFENQPWSIRELDTERSTLAKKLRGYHRAAPSSGAAMTKLNADLMADQAANQAMNDMLYSAADRSAGKPSGYFSALKKKQSILIDLGDDVTAHKKSLLTSSARQKGAPLVEKVHSHGYAHPTSARMGATGSLNPSKFLDPLKSGNKAIEKSFPGKAGKAVAAVRSGVSKTLSNTDLNALPLRALWSADWDTPKKPNAAQQMEDLRGIQQKYASSNPHLPAGE